MQSKSVDIEPPGTCTIGDIAGRYGVSLRTLRFYEDQGLLKPARFGTCRLYSSRDEIRLRLVIVGKRLGFSIREIRKLIQAHVDEKDLEPTEISAVLDRLTIERQIARMEQERNAVDLAIAELKAVNREGRGC